MNRKEIERVPGYSIKRLNRREKKTDFPFKSIFPSFSKVKGNEEKRE